MLTGQEQLAEAIRASQIQHRRQPESSKQSVCLSAEEIEDINDNYRTFRNLVTSGHNIDFLETALDMCREDQKKVERALESGDCTDFDVFLDLNFSILDLIQTGERITREKRDKKPAPKVTKRDNNLDVQELVEKKDIFSLICMLRVHQNEKRLDAALALLIFARDGEKFEDEESGDLRDEIRSSGGLQSLLTLFRTRSILYELKVVAAMAVAYVLPSFVESSSQTPPSLGLKIVECLRFLTTAHSVSHNGEVLGTDEMFKACATALG